MSNASIVSQKNELRKEIKKRILSLDDEYCHWASAKIIDKLMELPEYQHAQMVFTFIGIRGEVNTLPLIEQALAAGKRVCVPLCIRDGIMEAREIRNIHNDLSPGMMGILEPKEKTKLIHPTEIDFAVIPCVTGDHQGNRLGHGNGYYDRYLAKAQFASVMICFEKLISDHIPMDDFDQKISRMITERGGEKDE
ncbi:5-formyltetrahydrofolate cyclo-ligase [Clostridiales Family XIII bacterium PM5-7]